MREWVKKLFERLSHSFWFNFFITFLLLFVPLARGVGLKIAFFSALIFSYPLSILLGSIALFIYIFILS